MIEWRETFAAHGQRRHDRYIERERRLRTLYMHRLTTWQAMQAAKLDRIVRTKPSLISNFCQLRRRLDLMWTVPDVA